MKVKVKSKAEKVIEYMKLEALKMRDQLNQSRNFITNITSDSHLVDGKINKMHSLKNSNKKFKNNSSFAFESVDDQYMKK